MRIRNRPWAREELEASKFYENEPEKYKNKWKERFENNNPLHLEVGCGKGGFVTEISLKNPNINYIAVDEVDTMLGLAKRKIEKRFSQENKEINNLVLVRFDVERILNMLGEEDKIERIYINFCNPWPKQRHKKKRLTHTKQLENYKHFLIPGGEIHFKTDDDELFNESIKYFEESGFEIIYKTYDLHSENLEDNIETEHEKMFSEEGIKIKKLIAKKN